MGRKNNCKTDFSISLRRKTLLGNSHLIHVTETLKVTIYIPFESLEEILADKPCEHIATCFRLLIATNPIAVLSQALVGIILNLGCSAGISIKIKNFDDIKFNVYPEVQCICMQLQERDGNSVIFTSRSKCAL